VTNRHVPVELEDYTWPNTHTKYNWCHQSNKVRVWELSKVCISLSAPNCWCNRWQDRGHKPPLLAVRSYFTAGALLILLITSKQNGRRA